MNTNDYDAPIKYPIKYDTIEEMLKGEKPTEVIIVSSRPASQQMLASSGSYESTPESDLVKRIEQNTEGVVQLMTEKDVIKIFKEEHHGYDNVAPELPVRVAIYIPSQQGNIDAKNMSAYLDTADAIVYALSSIVLYERIYFAVPKNEEITPRNKRKLARNIPSGIFGSPETRFQGNWKDENADIETTGLLLR